MKGSQQQGATDSIELDPAAAAAHIDQIYASMQNDTAWMKKFRASQKAQAGDAVPSAAAAAHATPAIVAKAAPARRPTQPAQAQSTHQSSPIQMAREAELAALKAELEMKREAEEAANYKLLMATQKEAAAAADRSSARIPEPVGHPDAVWENIQQAQQGGTVGLMTIAQEDAAALLGPHADAYASARIEIWSNRAHYRYDCDLKQSRAEASLSPRPIEPQQGNSSAPNVIDLRGNQGTINVNLGSMSPGSIVLKN